MSREYVIYVGTQSKLMWDLLLECEQYKLSFRKWWTHPKKFRDYVEIAPYSKGNLYKIRKYSGGGYRVYYGTNMVAYCTRLKEALFAIDNQIK